MDSKRPKIEEFKEGETQKSKLKEFYPEKPPHKTYQLPVSTLHTLHISEYGNPKGIPVVVCHGGPGAGAGPFFSQYFNPEDYRIILFDQRGAGKSTPKGEMRVNTSQALVADLEMIRKHLTIDKWVMFGGSWGSTLALLYAEAFPQNVDSLVLRGVFLGRRKDSEAFVKDGSVAALMHPEEWEQFRAATTGLIIKSGLEVKDFTNYIDIYYRLLTEGSKEIQREAARVFACWEKSISFLARNPDAAKDAASDDGINMGLTEITYMKNDFFLTENEILANIGKIEDIETHIVQGRHDHVCPPYQAYELRKLLNNVTYAEPMSGHSTKQPETVDALMKVMENIAVRHKKEKGIEITVTNDKFSPEAMSYAAAATKKIGLHVNTSTQQLTSTPAASPYQKTFEPGRK